MELFGIEISKLGGRAFLKIGDHMLEVEDYEISSSANGGTRVKITIGFDDEFTEFSSSAKKESFRQLN